MSKTMKYILDHTGSFCFHGKYFHNRNKNISEREIMNTTTKNTVKPK